LKSFLQVKEYRVTRNMYRINGQTDVRPGNIMACIRRRLLAKV